MMNNFEKELTKIVEERVDKLVSKSDARDISEFARDEVVVARLDRTYDSKCYYMMRLKMIVSLKKDAINTD